MTEVEKKALTDAAVALEVLHAQHLHKPYRELSLGFMADVAKAVVSIRAALGAESTPPMVECKRHHADQSGWREGCGDCNPAESTREPERCDAISPKGWPCTLATGHADRHATSAGKRWPPRTPGDSKDGE